VIDTSPDRPEHVRRVPLSTIAAQWTRIGWVGFGGPPAHISLLRRLCVTERRWLSDTEFEDGIAATNLLPGPASTQLAIFCAWRLRGTAGGLLGGTCFILPGLALILALAALFLGSAPTWVQGAAAGAGSAVAAVAVHAAAGLVPGSWRRATTGATGHSPLFGARNRWLAYLVAGLAADAAAGPYLALVLVGCGLLEVAARRPPRPGAPRPGTPRPGTPGSRAPAGRPAVSVLPLLAAPAAGIAGAGGLGGLAWVALKVGLLSYGGGFVIIPLMQADAVSRYHWMSDGQFLNAVALGQVTPGPVVQTVAVVGYAAAGLGGGLLAAFVAFVPSFVLVLFGAQRFDRLRAEPRVQTFLTGAGPAVIGAIGGSAVPLAGGPARRWQVAVLIGAAIWLLLLRRNVVPALLLAGALGTAAAVIGLPVTA